MSTPSAETRHTALQPRRYNTRRAAERGRGDDSDELPSKRQKVQRVQGLCLACSKFDFDEIFQKADAHFAAEPNRFYTSRRGCGANRPYFGLGPDLLFVADLGDHPTRPGGCSMCSFFAAVRDTNTNGPFQLFALPSVACSPILKWAPNRSHVDGIPHNAFLAVLPIDAANKWLTALPASCHPIYRVLPEDSTPKPPGIWAKELKPSVDFSAVESWLSFCKQHHHEACGLAEHQRIEDLPGFRLIDCESSARDVLDMPPTEEYAALSYVWGEEAEVGTGLWPKVVLDAIVVTRKLGLRYLWVDRFCIDQQDAQTKHSLISRMATVYQNAEFTIVAAAGSGASHGLPGVDMTERKAQPKVRIGKGGILASPLENCREDIYQSTWWTRGWTYQEGVLARRRIVFTGSQVYWECGGMVTWEAIHLPLGSLHADGNAKFQSGQYMGVGVFSGNPYGSYFGRHPFTQHHRSESLLEVAEHIRKFSTRNLKYSTDSLLAMQGILSHYSDSDCRLTFIQGLPMFSKTTIGDGPNQRTRLASFAAGLTSWNHTNSSGQAQRLCHLPSWTWAGWKGEVAWETDGFSVRYSDAISDAVNLDYKWDSSDTGWTTDIRLHLGKQETRSLNEIPEDALRDLRFDGMLHIPQPYVIQRRDLPVKAGQHSWVARLEGGRHGTALNLRLSSCEVTVASDTDSISMVNGDLLFVLISISPEKSGGKIARFLVTRPVTPLRGASEHSTRYERIGIAWIQMPQKRVFFRTTEQDIRMLRVQLMEEEVVIC